MFIAGSEQFVHGMSEDQQEDSIRASFVSAAIYAALAIVSGSQLYLHNKLKVESPTVHLLFNLK